MIDDQTKTATLLKVDKPRETAFLANNPALNITLGLDVFVHEVIEAITILPCFNIYSFPFKVNLVPLLFYTFS